MLKVSGLTDPDDVRRAVALGADLIGCVLWAPSPRAIDVARAWELRQAAGGRARLVGIFVNTPRPLVQRLARQAGVDLLQFFGRESRQDLDHYGDLAAFKALTVERADQLEAQTRPFIGGMHLRPLPAPALLLHLSGAAASDWTAAAQVAAKAPILLASDALAPETVGEALAAVKPWGIDVWQQVEREPGRLDPAKLEALIGALRRGGPASS